MHDETLFACMQVLEFLAVDKKRKAPTHWWSKAPVCELVVRVFHRRRARLRRVGKVVNAVCV